MHILLIADILKNRSLPLKSFLFLYKKNINFIKHKNVSIFCKLITTINKEEINSEITLSEKSGKAHRDNPPASAISISASVEIDPKF